jgi:hypothetical protein
MPSELGFQSQQDLGGEQNLVFYPHSDFSLFLILEVLEN